MNQIASVILIGLVVSSAYSQDCGLTWSQRLDKYTKSDSDLTSGDLTSLENDPWIVGLVNYERNRNGVYEQKLKCGATIIHEQILLTAGHCFKDDIVLTNYTAVFGSTNVIDTYEKTRFEIPFNRSNVIIHEMYNQRSSYYDIAVIKLSEKIKFSEYVEKICLPSASNTNLSVPAIYAVGYGQSEQDSESDSYPLRSVKLDVHSKGRCLRRHRNGGWGDAYERKLKRTFPNYPDGEMLLKNQFCAGTNPRDRIMGTCPGDSGAPAYWFNQNDDRVIQYGVLHGSLDESSVCRNDKHPSIFTRVDDQEILNWITSTIRGGRSIKGQLRTLMVVTGWDGDNRDDSTQLVDLTSSTKACQNWNNYPIALSYATGSMVSGSPLVCGGSSPSRHDQCYLMDIEKKSWTFLTNMTTKRGYSASVALNGSLFVAGGHDGSDRHSSTEYVTADGVVSAGPDLPSPRSAHCMLALPSGKVMIMGGNPSENKKSVIVFDPDANSFDTSVPSLIHDRWNAGCAVFNSPSHNLRPVVLAVGGSGQATSEVYDFTQPNSKWTEIAILPRVHDDNFNGARAVTSPSGQGAIVQHYEHLYELQCQDSGCSWSILPLKLRQKVRGAVLFSLAAKHTCD